MALTGKLEKLDTDATKLLKELEDIYLSGPWRSDDKKVKREHRIREQLGVIYAEAANIYGVKL